MLIFDFVFQAKKPVIVSETTMRLAALRCSSWSMLESLLEPSRANDPYLLLYAVKNPDAVIRPKLVLALLEMGADPRVTGEDGETALYLAIEERDINVAQILLERGVDVNGQPDKDKIPLYVALWKSDEAAMKLLLGHGARIDFLISTCLFKKGSCLHMAIHHGHALSCNYCQLIHLLQDFQYIYYKYVKISL